ncbi:transaldolase [Kineosphaera limosa]|uniref:Transaldolase n=1 Tax=Kineosphaera limosa NBRC 100340 TaxID=1184609 RepID=K6WKZ1_9MICO|nr:transaldolase [Kineosphaera limosa]NYE03134.1 transaldolase [Kineosphaera limosa]GAB94471.1 transaldolase [Kineosphaera limosa NBRC 100340]
MTANTPGQASANPRLADVARAGVSIWLDDLNRPMLTSGELGRKVAELGVVGVTTNPTIFAAALTQGGAYDQQVAQLAAEGADVESAVWALTTRDVQDACDVLRPVFDATDGVDGRVSIEVDPRLARDKQGTLDMARRLWQSVDRPNVMIKIPATVEGLPAIAEAIAEGINVNVTLIFGIDRYRGVMNAYLTGLEQAREHGRDLSRIHSVASFFVSRVDSEVDQRLQQLADGEHADQARALAGKAGIANARLAYQAFEEVFSTPRWANLGDDGAHKQRPLWASTGVKNPEYPDTMYVTELIAPETVNTMPEKTLQAVADHGEVTGDTIVGQYEQSASTLDDLERLGISYTQVVEQLEQEGLTKFEASWEELLESVDGELQRAGAE